MSEAPHIPIFRFGTAYESLERVDLVDTRSETLLARVSQANAGMVRRDLKKAGTARDALQAHTTADALGWCRAAGELFRHGDLPIDGERSQSPEQYVETLSDTSGLPHRLVRANMEKVHHVLSNMETVLKGLTRGLDVSVLDQGMHEQDDLLLSFYPATDSLGIVLPSNSPGVNSLWLPSIALRIPVVLKPGREDPWTPWRIVQAFLAAGCPPEAFGFYPTDHQGSDAILTGCGRAILFGDASTVERYAGTPTVSVHGPGYSKILIGEDRIDDWGALLDLFVESVAKNSGRSCVNASTLVVPSHAREIAEALAKRLNKIRPLPRDHADAELASFSNPTMAEGIDADIDKKLKTPGAEDLSAPLRGGPRLATIGDALFLRPTVVLCHDRNHPLARSEYLFPFVAVVEVPQAEMTDWIGPTLVASAITDDPVWIRSLLGCPSIDRLNLGAIATPVVRWDQPHEGNLFEFLYRRRAIQRPAHAG